MGWGSHLEEDKLQGKWKPQEQCLHIIMLEIRAADKAPLGFSLFLGITALVSSDNSTIVSYIKRDGKNAISVPLEGEGTAIPTGHQSADSGENEYHCRPAFPPRPHSPHRMVAQPGDHKAPVLPFGFFLCRSLCHQEKQPAPNLCVFSSRSLSTGSRHPLPAMAKAVGLPRPASSAPRQAVSIQ